MHNHSSLFLFHHSQSPGVHLRGKDILEVPPFSSPTLVKCTLSIFLFPLPLTSSLAWRKSQVIQVLSHLSTFWVKHLREKMPTRLFHADTALTPNPESHCGNEGCPFLVLPKFSPKGRDWTRKRSSSCQPTNGCLSCLVPFFLCLFGPSSRTSGTQLDGMADASVLNGS